MASVKELLRMAKKTERDNELQNGQTEQDDDDDDPDPHADPLFFDGKKVCNLGKQPADASDMGAFLTEGGLAKYRLPAPMVSSLFLMNDFLTTPIATALILWSDAVIREKGVRLTGRSVLAFGGTVTPRGLERQQPLPQILDHFADLFVHMRILPRSKRPNTVLVNKYDLGGGILPHKDGPAYHPVVIIISVGGNTTFDVWEPKIHTPGSLPPDADPSAFVARGRVPVASVYVPNASLLVFQDSLYHDYLHGIAERESDDLAALDPPPLGVRDKDKGIHICRGWRTSFTFRYVPPKTS